MARYDGSTWTSIGGSDSRRSPGGSALADLDGLLTDVANFGGTVWVGSVPLDGVGGGLAFAPSGLEEGAWTVIRAGDGGLPSDSVTHVETWRGEVWVGTTAGVAVYDPPLAAPPPLTPVADATGAPRTPVLRWGPAAPASVYRIQVASSPDFAAPEREWAVPATSDRSLAVPEEEALEAETRYYWRVRTENASEISAWSEPRAFETSEAFVVRHGQRAERIERAPASDALWTYAGETLSYYDGEWTHRVSVGDFYADLSDAFHTDADDLPDFAAMSVAPDGAVWAGARPSSDVRGPDFYHTNPGFLVRLEPLPYASEAGSEYPPTGYTAVAAVDVNTAWACRATFSAPPDFTVEASALVRWGEGDEGVFEEVAGCRALVIDGGDGVWVGGEEALYRVGPDGVQELAPPISGPFSAVATAPDGRVWVGTESGEVAVYDPDAGTWVAHPVSSTSALGASVRAFAFYREFVWAATGAGLARFGGVRWTSWGVENGTLAVASVEDVEVQEDGALWVAAGSVVELRVPYEPDAPGVASGGPPPHEALALLPVYPNPARSRATLSFVLPSQGEASLVVYDVLGRLVATLIEGDLPAGRHQAAWEVGGVSGGAYVVRLIAAGGGATQKVIVLR